MFNANPICFRLLVQEIWRAFSRAFANAGSSIAARIAMMAITTSSSIKVKRFCFIMMFSVWLLSFLSLLVISQPISLRRSVVA